MTRSWIVSLIGVALTARLACAQPKGSDQLAQLRQAMVKTADSWESLAKALEPRIARLLPCDPKSHAAVEEVSRASEARLAALSAYLKAAAAKAKLDTDAAKHVLSVQAALAGGWNTEHAEADQQLAAIEIQVLDLKDSMRKRGSLAPAQQVLTELAAMVKDRSTKADAFSRGRDLIGSLLGDLVVGYQDRQTALEEEFAQAALEASRWNSYYAARIARATTECAIINSPAAARKKQP